MRRGWENPEREVTRQVRYFNRRKFLRTIGGMSVVLVVGCGSDSVFKPKEEEGDSPTPSTPGEPNPGPLNKTSLHPANANPGFPVPDDRPLTGEGLPGEYQQLL